MEEKLYSSNLENGQSLSEYTLGQVKHKVLTSVLISFFVVSPLSMIVLFSFFPQMFGF